MRCAIVSSLDVSKAGRWDPEYHLAVQEAARRFPSWTDEQARALLEPMAPRMPAFVREALSPLSKGQRRSSVLSVDEAIKVIQTYPLASLGCVAPRLSQWQQQVAEEEERLSQAKLDVEQLASSIGSARRPKP
jgi:hypothetical protein